MRLTTVWATLIFFAGLAQPAWAKIKAPITPNDLPSAFYFEEKEDVLDGPQLRLELMDGRYKLRRCLRKYPNQMICELKAEISPELLAYSLNQARANTCRSGGELEALGLETWGLSTAVALEMQGVASASAASAIAAVGAGYLVVCTVLRGLNFDEGSKLDKLSGPAKNPMYVEVDDLSAQEDFLKKVMLDWGRNSIEASIQNPRMDHGPIKNAALKAYAKKDATYESNKSRGVKIHQDWKGAGGAR